jgi:nitrite reductase/ring-hydroxylating ferredoxin subunit
MPAVAPIASIVRIARIRDSTMAFHPLDNTGNLKEGYRRTFRVGGHDLLLIHNDGETLLLDNICPHAGYPLEAGKIIEGKLRCPMHGYLFDIHTGDCTFHPEGPCRGVRVFAPVIRGDTLGVDLDTVSG